MEMTALSAPTAPVHGQPPDGSAQAAQGPSIFSQDWWLDATAPGAWRRVEVHWDAQLVGSLAFCVRRRYGLQVIEMPPYTRALGPVLTPPPAKPTRTLQNVLKIVDQLLAQLPPHDRFETCLEPNSEAALAFALLNYGIAQTYTFRARPFAPHFSIQESMHKKTRNVVVKAQRTFSVERSKDFSRFLAIEQRERAHASRLDQTTVSRLFRVAADKGHASLLVAMDPAGRDIAASAIIWDQATLYYWLSTRDPEASGANSLLIVKAIELAGEMAREFDMDGYGSIESGLFLARFGLTPVVRPYVNKSNRLWKALHAASAILGPSRIDRNYRF